MESNHICLLKGDSFFGRSSFRGGRLYFHSDVLMVPDAVIMIIKTVAGRNEVHY